jgi:SAM-dependent methyltransferase
MVRPDDVVLLYQRALGRTPSDEEVAHQVAHAADLRSLVVAILTSEEHCLRWARGAGGPQQAPASAVPAGGSWAERFPAPERPWTPEYTAGHEALVTMAIDDQALCAAVAGGDPLPAGYAAGYDERTVEYPWLFGQRPMGRVLDAGSTFNHSHILDRALPLVDELTILTLAPEAHAFPLRGVSYVYGDMRDLPFRDGWFNTVVSLSTLEHVGKDNATYGVNGAGAPDPNREVARAAQELRRVVVPGGRILLSVPFGRREDHGWFRQFDLDDLERLIAAFGVERHSVSHFRYARDGWQRATAGEAADLAYRDFRADSTPAADLAAAARGIACVAIEV